MTTEELQPKIRQFAVRQEKGDEHYGSCLWLYATIDLEHNILQIVSDAGNLSYRWPKQPDGFDTFLYSLRRERDYLLGKMSKKEFEFDKALAAIKHTFEEADDYADKREDLLKDFDDIESCDTADAFVQVVEEYLDAHHCSYEWYNVWDDVVNSFEYPCWAQRVIDMFIEYVIPLLKPKGSTE
ncbi:MAG: hypothetical protein IK093_17715 [Ruminiclostridium sp.]|nr:hypothetical protein [Ruminiclostridium sp.]